MGEAIAILERSEAVVIEQQDSLAVVLQERRSLGIAIPTRVNITAGANIKDETPGGVIDDSNAVFTLTSAPDSFLYLTLNGLRQHEGGTADFTRSGATITFNAPLRIGDVLRVLYDY